MKLTHIFILAAACTIYSSGYADAIEGSAELLYSIQGRVIDQASGAPLPRASVQLVELRRGTTTGSDGSFTIENVPHGSFTVRAQFVGFRTHEEIIAVPGDPDLHLRIDLLPDIFEFGEIIVTASPTGSTALYQPAQAFNAEDIQRRAALSIGELLDWEAGLAMRSFGPVPARPVIRGMDGDRVLVLDNSERLGDLSEITPDHSLAMDPMCADRIEVVRGPASLLYGSSALGGVINVFTDDLPRTWSRGTSGSAGLYGSTLSNLGSGFGRVQYGTDSWAATGRTSYRKSGDLYTPEGRLPGTYVEQFTGAAGTVFRHAAFDAGVSIELLDKKYGLPEDIDDPDTDIEIRMDRQRLRGHVNLQGAGFIQNTELRISGSRYFHEEIEVHREGGAAVGEDMELDFTQHTLSTTLTLTHGSAGFISSGVFGVNGILRKLETRGPEALTPDARSDFIGLFIYEEFPLGSDVRLQTGGRVEFQRIEATANEKYPDFSLTRRSATFSGSVGANYTPSDVLEIGFQLARAHRVPSLEELFSDATHLASGAYEVGNPDQANEIGHGADMFVRYTSTRTAFDAAVFVNSINDFIVRRPTGEIHEPSGFPVIVYEAGDALLYGGEIGFQALIERNLILRLRTDYVRGSRRDVGRTPLPFIPPLRSYAGLIYDTRTWWLSVNLRIAFDQNRTAPEEDPTDGYVLTGWDAGYRFDGTGRHVVSFRMDNVFNTVYRDHLSRIEDRNFPMPGRSAHLMYKWYF